MKEAEGNIAEAADILQEVPVVGTAIAMSLIFSRFSLLSMHVPSVGCHVVVLDT